MPAVVGERSDVVGVVDPWIRALSIDGAMAIESYPPWGSIDVPVRMPSGARVEASFPGEASTFTAHAVLGTETTGHGYQVMPYGSGPLCMAPELAFEAQGPVDFEGGVLAYYRVVQPHHTFPGMTVWQVGAYDIVTFDHLSLEDAVAQLGADSFEVSGEGVTIVPADRAIRVRQESLIVEADGLLYEITQKTMTPSTAGVRGRHGDFYRHGEDFLLFFSDTAYAEIQRVEPAVHDELPAHSNEHLGVSTLDQSQMQRLQDQLAISWVAQ